MRHNIRVYNSRIPILLRTMHNKTPIFWCYNFHLYIWFYCIIFELRLQPIKIDLCKCAHVAAGVRCVCVCMMCLPYFYLAGIVKAFPFGPYSGCLMGVCILLLMTNNIFINKHSMAVSEMEVWTDTPHILSDVYVMYGFMFVCLSKWHIIKQMKMRSIEALYL